MLAKSNAVTFLTKFVIPQERFAFAFQLLTFWQASVFVNAIRKDMRAGQCADITPRSIALVFVAQGVDNFIANVDAWWGLIIHKGIRSDWAAAREWFC